MTVDIDVQPKNTANVVRLSTKNPLKVAILSSESFDATQIDPDSIRFGMGGATADRPKFKDVNNDGFVDLEMRFTTPYTWIRCGDTEVKLNAETYDGQMVSGSDAINTAQCY